MERSDANGNINRLMTKRGYYSPTEHGRHGGGGTRLKIVLPNVDYGDGSGGGDGDGVGLVVWYGGYGWWWRWEIVRVCGLVEAVVGVTGGGVLGPSWGGEVEC